VAVAEAPSGSPLLAEADRWEAELDRALARRDVPAAVNAVLELDQALMAWSADTTQSDEPDRVRATLRSMIVRLGEAAAAGAQDPRTVVEPFVALVLDARAAARSARDWTRSDELRDRLAAAGVEVRDTPAGQEWHLSGDPRHPGEGGGSGW
jgi:cysteinyl-tRNA synthetase